MCSSTFSKTYYFALVTLLVTLSFLVFFLNFQQNSALCYLALHPGWKVCIDRPWCNCVAYYLTNATALVFKKLPDIVETGWQRGRRRPKWAHLRYLRFDFSIRLICCTCKTYDAGSQIITIRKRGRGRGRGPRASSCYYRANRWVRKSLRVRVVGLFACSLARSRCDLIPWTMANNSYLQIVYRTLNNMLLNFLRGR